MNLLTLLLQTTDTLVTPPVLTPTVETAGDLNLWELACKGGIIMIPLLLLSLLSIYIFFERLQVIRKRFPVKKKNMKSGLTQKRALLRKQTEKTVQKNTFRKLKKIF